MRIKVKTAGKHFITGLILANAGVAGLLTADSVKNTVGPELETFCNVSIIIFVAEIFIRIGYGKKDFFIGKECGWNWLDLIITLVSAFSIIGSLSAFRVLRLLRELRLLRAMSSFHNLRIIIETLLRSLPSILWSGIFFIIIFYLYAIIGVNLFGETFYDWFGTLGKTMYTLFQVMTLESWSMGISRIVMRTHPAAWIYFISFILIASYILINLIVGIIVAATAETSAYERMKQHEGLSTEIDKLKNQLELVLDLLDKEKEKSK